jgi:hypothetical protein
MIQTIGANATVALHDANAAFNSLANLTQINGKLQVTGGNTFTPQSANGSQGGVGVAGVLQVGAGSTFAKPAEFGNGSFVTVQSGGLLTGAGTVSGPINALAGAIVRPGDGGAIGNLTASALTFGNGATLNIVGGYSTNSTLVLSGSGNAILASGNSSKLTISLTNDGTLNLNGHTSFSWTVISLTSGSLGSITSSDFNVVAPTNFSFSDTPSVDLESNAVIVQFIPTVVPEPGWIIGLASGVLVIGRLRRRRFTAGIPEPASA